MTLYNPARQKLLTGSIDWASTSTGRFKVMLVSTSYTFSRAHEFVSELSTYELTASGYSRQDITGRSVTIDSTANRARALGANVTFSDVAAGQTVGGCAIFQTTGADASADLISFFDLADTPTPSTDIKVQLQSSALGWFVA